MNLFFEFAKIVEKLNEKEIPYVVIGGVALAFYTTPRFTKDIDILILEKELKEVNNILQELDFFPSASSWTFQNTQLSLHRYLKIDANDEVMLDILVGNNQQYQEIINNAETFDTSQIPIKVINKQDLIKMKKLRKSSQDLVDIESLKNEKN